MAPQRQGTDEEDTSMRPRLATSLGGGGSGPSDGTQHVFLVGRTHRSSDSDDSEGAETAAVHQPSSSSKPHHGDSDRGGSGGPEAGPRCAHGRAGASPEDDELTSLTWLQDCNLLRSIHPPQGPDAARKGGACLHQNGSDSGAFLDEDSSGGAAERGASPSSGGAHGEIYNPAVHIYAKPPYSFSCLIFMAIEDSSAKALPVKDIYTWILAHFPYFQNAPTGWKNSVRHNLSLNKCFLKVDKGQNIAKGSLWCIDPEYRPNLLQALRKTSYSPYNHIKLPLDISSSAPFGTVAARKSLWVSSTKTVANMPNPDLFPYLSKRLAASATKDPEVDAAATMLSLKNGPRILSGRDNDVYTVSVGHDDEPCMGTAGHEGDSEKTSNGTISPTRENRHKRLHDRTRVSNVHAHPPTSLPLSVCVPVLLPNPVITVSPSEDHTYSSTSSPRHGNSDSPGTSSIDEPFEFERGGLDGALARRGGQKEDEEAAGGSRWPEDGREGDSGRDSGVTRSTISTSSDEGSSNGRAEEKMGRSGEWTKAAAKLMATDVGGDAAKSAAKRLLHRRHSNTRRHLEDEEQKKIAEGADALLNLARVCTEEVRQNYQEARSRRRRKQSRRSLRHVVPEKVQR